MVRERESLIWWPWLIVGRVVSTSGTVTLDTAYGGPGAVVVGCTDVDVVEGGMGWCLADAGGEVALCCEPHPATSDTASSARTAFRMPAEPYRSELP